MIFVYNQLTGVYKFLTADSVSLFLSVKFASVSATIFSGENYFYRRLFFLSAAIFCCCKIGRRTTEPAPGPV